MSKKKSNNGWKEALLVIYVTMNLIVGCLGAMESDKESASVITVAKVAFPGYYLGVLANKPISNPFTTDIEPYTCFEYGSRLVKVWKVDDDFIQYEDRYYNSGLGSDSLSRFKNNSISVPCSIFEIARLLEMRISHLKERVEELEGKKK